MKRAGRVTCWTLAVIATMAIVGGILGTLPLAAQQGSGPQAKCQPGPNALGVSRTIEIDATGGPRFGRLQYRDHDFLQDGEVVLTFDDGLKEGDAIDLASSRPDFLILAYPVISMEPGVTHNGSRVNLIGPKPDA